MNTVSARASLPALLTLGVLLGSGCSFVVDSEKAQCKQSSECADKFGQSALLVCEQGLCLQPSCQRDDDCTKLGAAFAGSVCERGQCQQPSSSEPPGWACLDNPPAQMSLPGPFNVQLHLVDMALLSSLPDVRVKVCRTLDVDCQNPVDSTVSDGDGNVTVSVPAMFRGYVALDGEGLMPTMYFFSPPIQKDQNIGDVQMGAPFVGMGLSSQAGLKLDPERGIVLMSAYDCMQTAAAGITFSSVDADGETTPFYAIDTAPSITATATDRDGFGGFINAKAGALSIDGTRSADGRNIGTVSVLVKAGGLTVTRISPGL